MRNVSSNASQPSYRVYVAHASVLKIEAARARMVNDADSRVFEEFRTDRAQEMPRCNDMRPQILLAIPLANNLSWRTPPT